MARYFPYQVIDEFLSTSLRDQLLRHTLDNADAFSPTRIYSSTDNGVVDESVRRSLTCEKGLGHLKPKFKEVIHAALPTLIPALGCSVFDFAGMELGLVVHPHGSFFRPHIDTRTQPPSGIASERMLTLVYYFHTHPKRFTGGEIAILPIGSGDPILIEPRDNRLVAFASFVPHEVRAVICQPDEFSHSRFAVNCWVHRKLP